MKIEITREEALNMMGLPSNAQITFDNERNFTPNASNPICFPNQKLQAIKIMREVFDMGLREAKILTDLAFLMKDSRVTDNEVDDFNRKH